MKVVLRAMQLFALLALSESARAEPSLEEVQRTVRVQQGVTCLARSSLHQQILTWLRGAELDPRVSVEVVGSEDDPRSATVRVRSTSGEFSERSFAPGPERCADFLSAVGLAAALALKQSEVVRPIPSAAHADEEATPPMVPRVSASPRARKLLLSGGALLMWPDQPPVMTGGELLLEYRLAHAVKLRGGMAALLRGRTELVPRVTYSLRQLAARLEVCAPFSPSRHLSLDLCAALLTGRLSARSHGALRRQTTMRLLDAGPSLVMAGALNRRWAWTLSAALLLGLEPRKVSVTRGQERELEPLPRLAALLSLGLSYTLLSLHDAAR